MKRGFWQKWKGGLAQNLRERDSGRRKWRFVPVQERRVQIQENISVQEKSHWEEEKEDLQGKIKQKGNQLLSQEKDLRKPKMEDQQPKKEDQKQEKENQKLKEEDQQTKMEDQQPKREDQKLKKGDQKVEDQ